MISFKKFFLLHESLADVPRKLMGVFNDDKDIPTHAPYGFWVDKSGNFIPTSSHLSSAQKMLERANDYLGAMELPLIEYDKSDFADPYRPFYENGWIRVISMYDPIAYETRHGTGATLSQLKFLKKIKEQYRKNGIYHDVHRGRPMEPELEAELAQLTIPRRKAPPPPKRNLTKREDDLE